MNCPSAHHRTKSVFFAAVIGAVSVIGCGDSGSTSVDAGNTCVEDPAFCQSSNAVCGVIQREGGSCVSCGRCTLPLLCGGAGVANQCGCTPRDCATEGVSCGEIDDGCGNQIVCGVCPADQFCQDRTCAPYIPVGQNCTIGVEGCVAGTTCCLVGTGTFCVDSPSPGVCPGELPDLITRYKSTRGSIESVRMNFDPAACAVAEGCLSGTGDRRLLRFGTFIENVGRRSLQLGIPGEDAAFQSQVCNGVEHFNWPDFLAYSIHTQNPDGSLGPALAENVRASYCLEDGKGLLKSGPSDGFSCASANTRQGLTRRWGFTYETEIDCQWVDVTDVPPGDYILRVTIDPLNKIAEEREDNNTNLFDVRL